MLQGFKEAGKKVFLLTNSLWDYTQVVMNFLHKEHLGVKAADRSLHWTEYFDLIIVGGNKPSFLRDDL